MTAEVAEVLDKAADEVERRGWMQGHLGNDITNPSGCKVCAIGAVNAAVNGTPFATVFTLLPLIALEHFTARDIAGWNDAPGRTACEVVAALRAAASAERAS